MNGHASNDRGATRRRSASWASLGAKGALVAVGIGVVVLMVQVREDFQGSAERRLAWIVGILVAVSVLASVANMALAGLDRRAAAEAENAGQPAPDGPLKTWASIFEALTYLCALLAIVVGIVLVLVVLF